MKKALSILLTLVMLLSIFSCVPDEDESLLRDENGNFQKKQTA